MCVHNTQYTYYCFILLKIFNKIKKGTRQRQLLKIKMGNIRISHVIVVWNKRYTILSIYTHKLVSMRTEKTL